MVTVLFLRSLNEITQKSLNMDILTEHPNEKRCLKTKVSSEVKVVCVLPVNLLLENNTD